VVVGAAIFCLVLRPPLREGGDTVGVLEVQSNDISLLQLFGQLQSSY